MKNFGLFSFASLILTWSLFGQDTASMSSPILRATAEEIRFSATFANFGKGSDYRLGIATVEGGLEGAKVELLKAEAPVAKDITNFKQGFAGNWFNVDEISVQGYVFSASELPEGDEELTLRAVVPRAEADKAQRLFVIVAKRYGENVWYIVDGAEMGQSDW